MPKKDRSLEVARARSALIIAAKRRTILTYAELGEALDESGVYLRNQLRHVLDDLSADCDERGEPSLAALVVKKNELKPGAGWSDGSVGWAVEVQKVFKHWTY
jgi:hypothetical protein